MNKYTYYLVCFSFIVQGKHIHSCLTLFPSFLKIEDLSCSTVLSLLVFVIKCLEPFMLYLLGWSLGSTYDSSSSLHYRQRSSLVIYYCIFPEYSNTSYCITESVQEVFLFYKRQHSWYEPCRLLRDTEIKTGILVVFLLAFLLKCLSFYWGTCTVLIVLDVFKEAQRVSIKHKCVLPLFRTDKTFHVFVWTKQVYFWKGSL